MGQGQGQSQAKDDLQLAPLQDNFILGKKKLGEGAYGTVWTGNARTTNAVVAIKQLSKAKLKHGGVKLRHNMEREVVMMRACQHENIVQLLGVFQEEKFVYLVMECCEGGDVMDRVIGSKSTVREEQMAEWSRQMCAAVAALHAKRICHRDLKPQNYMLTRTGQLKLSDFGLAVFLPEGQVLSERCGTPAFMSPELHLLPRKSRGYSFPADAWALGLCIYMVVYKHHPFVDSRGGIDEPSLLTARLTFGEDDSSLGSLLQSIKNGIGATQEPVGPGRSTEARQLCSSLTCTDEMSRMSAAQALQSPWCARGGALRQAQAANLSCDPSAQVQNPNLSRTSSKQSASVAAPELLRASSKQSAQAPSPDLVRTSSKQSAGATSSSGSGRIASLGGYLQADDEPKSSASDSTLFVQRTFVESPTSSWSTSSASLGTASWPLSHGRHPYGRAQTMQSPSSLSLPIPSESPFRVPRADNQANLPNLLKNQLALPGEKQEHDSSLAVPAPAGLTRPRAATINNARSM